jgi:hypothetical protein
MRLLIALALVAATPAAAQDVPPPAVTTTLPADATPLAAPNADTPPPTPPADTYEEKDVIAAAEGVFGRGAAGAAKLVEKAFKDLGRPNGYIVGREASGALIVGLRYGSGTLYSKIEGAMPVYWTGPSVGFDIGGDGAQVFTLVYHLDDSADLFRRYPGGEGHAYVIGGFTATYNQRDRVILVPIKLGVGLRLGLNAGWVNYTRESRLKPF